MIDVKNIVLTHEEIKKCTDFSLKQSGSTTPRDALFKKLSEVAFCKMMNENYGMKLSVSFENTGSANNRYLDINGWKIDVKSGCDNCRFMLINWEELNAMQLLNELPHLYVMYTVGWNAKTELPTGKVVYHGAASLSKMKSSCPITTLHRKGELLPETSIKVADDCYAVHFRHLYKHLNHLVQYLTEDTPPAAVTANYKNPYTGETTMQILAADSAKK